MFGRCREWGVHSTGISRGLGIPFGFHRGPRQCKIRMYYARSPVPSIATYLLLYIEQHLYDSAQAVIGGEKPSRDLQMLVAESHRQNLNVLLFVAGRGKLEKATSLAAKSCALLRDTCFCAVVDGLVFCWKVPQFHRVSLLSYDVCLLCFCSKTVECFDYERDQQTVVCS